MLSQVRSKEKTDQVRKPTQVLETKKKKGDDKRI